MKHPLLIICLFLSVTVFARDYPATVTDVYDGDTITVTVDLGMDVFIAGQKMRLLGIDTPELRGVEREDGLKVRDFVRELILNKKIVIQIPDEGRKKGKYGRWLCIVLIDGKNLNKLLVEKGFAREYK